MGTQRVKFDFIRRTPKKISQNSKKFSQNSNKTPTKKKSLFSFLFFLAGLNLCLLIVLMKLRVLGQVSEINGAFLRDDGVDDRFVLLHAHVVRFELELELAVHAEGVVFLEDGEVVVDVVEIAHLVPALGYRVEGRDNYALLPKMDALLQNSKCTW